MSKTEGLSLVGVALGLLLGTSQAQAYCRTTTCKTDDALDPDFCQYDQDNCAINGKPLAWPQACVAFSVQKDGSPKRGIAWTTMQAIESDAYYQWSMVDCGGRATPSIRLFDRSPVNCDAVEYNQDLDTANANIWMFRDQWLDQEDAGTLALTTVTFDPISGQIYDADVEINSAQNRITVGDQAVVFDLQSIVIHEAGHTLGLSHSPVGYATMFYRYDQNDGSLLLRTLSDDDVAGICEVYPPGQERGACDHTARHGFSTECHAKLESGCAVRGSVGTGGGADNWGDLWGWGLGLVASFGLCRRTRRRDTPSGSATE
jgi:hypothetical protein